MSVAEPQPQGRACAPLTFVAEKAAEITAAVERVVDDRLDPVVGQQEVAHEERRMRALAQIAPPEARASLERVAGVLGKVRASLAHMTATDERKRRVRKLRRARRLRPASRYRGAGERPEPRPIGR